MKTRQYQGALLGGLILSLGSLGLQAQEANPASPPPKERPAPQADAPEGVRAERIRQRIRDLNNAGKHEEANQMAERMRQAHMKRGQRQMADKTPRGKAGKPEGGKADKKEVRQAGDGHPERKGPPQPMGPPPVMKIRNLKMAAGLLDAAGYGDQAVKARQEAGRIEGEMREMAEREDKKRKEEEAKRREMGKHTAQEMKDRPDPAAGMREEMQKLRREVEELRGQLRKARAEAESRPDRGRRGQNRPR